MRRLLFVLPLLVLAGCKKAETQGAVKVVVNYTEFRPGCLRVQVTDTASGKSRVQDLTEIKGEAGVGGTMLVGVVPPSDWGADLDVKATAFEKASCDSLEVVSASGRVTVANNTVQPVTLNLQARDADKDGFVDVATGGSDCKDNNEKIHPGAEELCNEEDDNCDGVSDTDHFKLNLACDVSADCKGVSRCNAETLAVYCDSPPTTTVYPDADGDGYGSKGSQARVICGAMPSGYTSGPPTDCRDDVFSINPGTQDLCDGEDTNCDGTADEGFPAKGMTCTNLTSQCEGTNQCSADKRGLDCVTPPVPKWYLDEDGDGYGGTTVVESCVKPAGPYVQQTGDCDDGNPYTNPGASEICDDLDNDCSGQKETAAQCPGAAAPGWAMKTVEGGSDWLSASSWGTKTTGGIWVSGTNNRRARLTLPETAFTAITSTNCGSITLAGNTEWMSVWSDPADGRAWLGSKGGIYAYLAQGAANCVSIHDQNLEVRGLTGLRKDNVLSLRGLAECRGKRGLGLHLEWHGSPCLQRPHKYPQRALRRPRLQRRPHLGGGRSLQRATCAHLPPRPRHGSVERGDGAQRGETPRCLGGQ